jgi:hypothetical protein
VLDPRVRQKRDRILSQSRTDERTNRAVSAELGVRLGDVSLKPLQALLEGFGRTLAGGDALMRRGESPV